MAARGPKRRDFVPKHFVVVIGRSLESPLGNGLTLHLRDGGPVELGIDGVDRTVRRAGCRVRGHGVPRSRRTSMHIYTLRVRRWRHQLKVFNESTVQ